MIMNLKTKICIQMIFTCIWKYKCVIHKLQYTNFNLNNTQNTVVYEFSFSSYLIRHIKKIIYVFAKDLNFREQIRKK